MATKAVAKRRVPSAKLRTLILSKTGRRCHVCGGPLDRAWHADHVRPHARGGLSSEDNFLPSCSICNRARWSLSPIEFRKVLAYGIFAKRQMGRDSVLGRLFREGYRKSQRAARHRRTAHAK